MEAEVEPPEAPLFVEEKRATPSQLLRPHYPAKTANENSILENHLLLPLSHI